MSTVSTHGPKAKSIVGGERTSDAYKILSLDIKHPLWLRMSDNAKSPPERFTHHRTAIGQAQRAKTRAWIIECAIPVFAERGPDSPVIDDFAKAAGISRGTFYTYFKTTGELLDAATSSISDSLIAIIAPAVHAQALRERPLRSVAADRRFNHPSNSPADFAGA
uniref:TetR/AcrR family transcriptional regulator n=1 Tax=Cupriavidus necator TaxID=106590 RepID=UPI003ECC41D9